MRNANGELGAPGDTHYRCLHGNKRVLTITKKMRCCLAGELTSLILCNALDPDNRQV